MTVFSSIRTRLAFYFSLTGIAVLTAAVLVHALGLPFLGYDGMRGNRRQLALQHLADIADLGKTDVLRWLEERSGHLGVMADHRRVVEDAQILCNAPPGSPGNPETTTEERRQEARRVLTEFLEQERVLYRVDRLAVVDLKGRVVASTAAHDLLSAWPDLTGIRAAVSAGGPGAHASVSALDKTALHLYRTVAGDEGKPIAALVVGISPPDLFEPLRRVTDRLGASGEVVLVNRDRQILSPLKFPLEDGTRPGPLECRIEAVPAASAAQGLEGIVESLDYRGEPVVAAYRYIPVGADIGWGMVVKRDSKEVFAPVRREIAEALALGLLAVIPMIALVLGVARRLTRPLAELSQAARQVSEGDLSVRAPVGPADEVGMLASTFNSMVERVQLRRRELEQQVADRTRAERALAESHGTLRAIIEGTTDVVFLKDVQGRYMIANSACARLLGSSQEEILGRSDRDFFPPDTAQRLAAADRRVMALGEPEIVEEAIETSDSVTGTYSVLKAPFRDESGAIIGVLGIARDVTEQRRLEEEVARARHLEALGTLAGGIAHDFNNYLTGLRGAIALARSKVDPQDEAHEVLSNAEKESLRASGLAEQLLTFARGGAPVRKMASLGEIIRDTVTFALSGSNVKAEIAIPSDLWSAQVDEGQISQVISNVVRNADEAMPEGGVVTVSAENVIVTAADALPVQSGSYAKLSIRDHGPGMPAETQRRAFDPYFTTKQNGSGLGLAVAGSIVSKHGGHIAVKSQMGAGTTVSVYLPSSSEGAPAQVAEKMRPDAARGRVLFVDDEAMITLTHSAILGNMGYKVDWARDGREAVARYRDAKDSGEPFDAVIMDLTLPGGLGGREATRQLLDMDREARVIASSGHSNDPVMANFAEHGFKAVVPKPYSTEELTSTLEAVMHDEDTRDR
jgi:PAS domain S-box-containing protein